MSFAASTITATVLSTLLVFKGSALAQAPDSSGAPTIASSHDGAFRVYAVIEDNIGNAVGMGRRVSRMVVPDFPAAARDTSQADRVVYVMMRITSAGIVDSVIVNAMHRIADPVAATIDSAAAQAAARWTWYPSDAGAGYRGAMFVYQRRPVSPTGEGDVFVRARESVSHEPLPDTRADVLGVKTGLSFKAGGAFLIKDVPAGQRQVRVPDSFSLPLFKSQTIPLVVHAGQCDTLDVVLEPSVVAPEGRTYWTHSPAPLPVRDEDYRRFPRAGFRFTYEAGLIRLDSARETFTEKYAQQTSLVDTTIHLALSAEELDRIYGKLIEVQLFDQPGPHPSYDGGNVHVSPSEDIAFDFTAGDTTKHMSWNTGRCFPYCQYPSDDWKRVYEVEHMILDMLNRHPEYRSLPPAFRPNM